MEATVPKILKSHRLCSCDILDITLNSLLRSHNSQYMSNLADYNIIYFSIWCPVKVKSLSCVRLCATPWTAACQAPLSMGFSRQQYWSGLPFPSPRDLPNPGTESRSPALHADAFTIWATREVQANWVRNKKANTVWHSLHVAPHMWHRWSCRQHRCREQAWGCQRWGAGEGWIVSLGWADAN